MADDSSDQNMECLRTKVKEAAEQGDTQVVLAVLQNSDRHIQDEILTRGAYEGSVLKTAVENHQMDIVKLLVEAFHVDINVTTFHSHARSDSALFYAIRKGNEKLVKELVELGANIDIVSGALTPLIVACHCRSISMVKLLIKLGANVNLQAGYGISPVMALSPIVQPAAHLIVDFLLDKGADCNLQDENGATALHKAAFSRNDTVVHRLLCQQARLLPNNYGFTPHFLAAEWSTEKGTLGVFLDSDELSREEEINALEFRAASLAPDDMNKAYELLHKAIEARHENPSNILRKPISEPIAAFGNLVESQTPEELEIRKDDDFALLMECLAVQHRLLGGGAGTMCRTRNFYSIWKKLMNAGKYEQAIAFAEHGIGAKPSIDALSIFNEFLQILIMNSQSPGISMLSGIERGLQWCIKILQGFPEANVTYSIFYLKLLKQCIQLDPTSAKQTATKYAKNFIDSFPLRDPHFCSALHAATYLRTEYEETFDLSSYMSVVDCLVKCGAKINERDAERHTVLAYVLHDMTPGDNRREIVRFLLEKNANPAYLRKKNERPNDYIKDADVVQLLQQHYPLPLSHLAAFTIVDSGIQYEGLIPSILEEFVGSHE